MRETVFINFNLKLPPELYLDGELPNELQIMVWTAELAERGFVKWGVSYHAERKAFIASYTYRGGKTTEPDPCITSFGSSLLSAYQKLYVLVAVLGFHEFGEDIARTNQEAIEFALSKELKKAMGK